MDNTRKRTWIAIGIALALHLAWVWWFPSPERVIEVPLDSAQISTRMGFAPKTQPKSKPTPKPKPKVVQKTEPKKVKVKRQVKKLITTSKPQKVAVPKPQEAPVKQELATKPAPSATTKPKQEAGGAPKKVDPNDLRKYINKVARKIDRKKRYPRLAKENGEEGVVMIKMTLDRNGTLIAYRLSRKAPSERLNQATLSTVQSAAPFPPLPSSYPNSKITIEVPLRFRLARRF